MQETQQKLFDDVYQDLRVVVTGNTGFKGSWTALWLSQLGAKVLGYSLDDCGAESHFNKLALDIETVFADVRDKQKLVDTFVAFKPQIVFHMAAQPLVRASYADPSFTFETNVVGTLNVMEAARTCGTVRTVVNITTDKVYENLETNHAYAEEDRLGGHDPYSASKACAEILTASYRRSFAKTSAMLIATVRAGNVIGGGDWSEDRLIPDLVRAASKAQSSEIRSPRSTRPWQHVLDPVSGYLLLGQLLHQGNAEFATAWNFGPDQTANIDVQTVIELMQTRWEKIKYHVDHEEAKRFHEAALLMLDCTQATQKLKWKPTWEINATIDRTSAWYKAYCEDSELLTVAQLKAYVADARAQQQVWT